MNWQAKTYCRRPGVIERKLGDSLFLAEEAEGRIHHLDRMAAAAWHALAEPRTGAELVELFAAAFPGIPPQRVAKDIEALLLFLGQNQLIEGSSTERG